MRERVAVVGRDVRFAAGEWVDLLPSDDLLAGFTARFGAWRVEKTPAGRRLVGTCEPGERLSLHCDLDAGPRYEVSLTVERPGERAQRVDSNGLTFDYGPASGEYLVAVWDHARNRAALNYRGIHRELTTLELPESVSVRVRSYDGTAEMSVRGMPKPFVFQRPPTRTRQPSVWTMAVGTFENLPQGRRGTLYITEWKIRKLDRLPLEN